MSETKENCPECGHLQLVHLTDHHLSVRRGWLPDCPACCHDHLCPCTRTYESLVGEKQECEQRKHEDKMKRMVEMQSADLSKCPCRTWATTDMEFVRNFDYRHHPNCDGHGKPKTQFVTGMSVAEPELQLLIIDMGNCCIVQGDNLDTTELPKLKGTYLTDRMYWIDLPFTKLREALDGVKPLPRIDPCQTGGLYRLKTNVPDDDTFLSQTSIDALSELVGKPLPIWEGGIWEDLLPRPEIGIGWELPIGVWRYKR